MQVRRWIAFSATTAGILIGFLFATSPALAQRGPVLVVPGRPGVPVLLFGNDISWAVVEGDWGLARPGQVSPTVIYRLPPGALIGPAPYYRATRYYPTTGRAPRVGRLEIVPPANRRLPPPVQTYYRSWSSQSGAEPATTYPPYDPPPVIIGPQFDRRPPGQHRP